MKSLLTALARELDARAIGYLVIGGQAVLLYGEPRFTKDIDVTLALEPDQLRVILDLAQKLNLRPIPSDPDAFVRRTFVLPCIHDESSLGVDFIFSFSGFERAAIERGAVRIVDGTPVRFATAEDLLIQKIVASRPQDLSDARAIVIKNPGLDEDYVKRWLAEFAPLVDVDVISTWNSLRRLRT